MNRNVKTKVELLAKIWGIKVISTCINILLYLVMGIITFATYLAKYELESNTFIAFGCLSLLITCCIFVLTAKVHTEAISRITIMQVDNRKVLDPIKYAKMKQEQSNLDYELSD